MSGSHSTHVMPDEDACPTQRPMGRFRDDELGFRDERSSDATLIPWIDSHTHLHTLSWSDRQQVDLSGGLAVVMVAAAAHYSPYRPIHPEDVRFLWDDAIRRSHAISRSHFFDSHVAVAVHTVGRKVDYEELLDDLPAYAELDEVVAIGETGISMTQYTDPWPVEDQKEVVVAQMRIADDANLPLICHTPSITKGEAWLRGKTEEGHDLAEPVLDRDSAKLDAVEIDVEFKDEAGLPDRRLVLDHAHPSMVPFVMESTDCYLSFSVGQWYRDTDVEDVADAIDEYGPDRIMVDTDAAGFNLNEPFGMKKAILDLLRMGIDEAAIRKVVYENPRSVLGLSSLPE